jgi:hypothetical protein
MFVAEGCRGSRRSLAPYRRCAPGHTTDRARSRRDKCPVKPEPDGAFIGLSARIALHVQLHHSHYRRKGRPQPGVTQPLPSFGAGEAWGKARRVRAMVSRPLITEASRNLVLILSIHRIQSVFAFYSPSLALPLQGRNTFLLNTTV